MSIKKDKSHKVSLLEGIWKFIILNEYTGNYPVKIYLKSYNDIV